MKDNCRYNITVKTHFACLTQTRTSCSITNENVIYDLSPLAKYDSNYVIRDSSNLQLVYVINVCLPVVTNSDALCPATSTICQKNSSDFNVKRKFKSLAGTHPLVIDKNRLKIESYSEYCSSGQNYKTVMYFDCSQHEVSYCVRIVVMYNVCCYRRVPFCYKNRSATMNLCGVHRTHAARLCNEKNVVYCMIVIAGRSKYLISCKKCCLLKYSVLIKYNWAFNFFSLDLTDANQKRVLLKDDNTTTLTFDICSDDYTKCKAGKCRHLFFI